MINNKYTKEYLSNLIRKNIKKYRLKKNLTLQELADLSELSHGYIRDLECLSIDKTPTIETLGKISNALETDIKCFFDEIQ